MCEEGESYFVNAVLMSHFSVKCLNLFLIQYSACFECFFFLNDSITLVLILNVLKTKHNTNKMYPKAQNTQNTSFPNINLCNS